MIEDYAKHAVVWDWDGYDNTPEYEYWCNYARNYGSFVLSPMCALGNVGAYMAEHGFSVTAFDLTEKMILEGKKRFGYVENLELVIADICNFNLFSKIYDFVFVKDQDLHLLSTIEEVKKALLCINKHMRKGGCLVLELTLPISESFETQKQIFHPRKPNYTDKKVWKESECKYDAVQKRNYINQVVHVETDERKESFEYSICLQYFDRVEILNVLKECGYIVEKEYSDREGTEWTGAEGFWSVQAIKL